MGDREKSVNVRLALLVSAERQNQRRHLGHRRLLGWT